MTPALIVLAIGVDPTEALVLSQVVLSFGIPFALVPLVLLTRRRDIMGALVNRPRHDGRREHRRGADHRAEPVPAVPARSLLRLLSPAMAMADTFSEMVDSLPDDWTDLELDLRISDEERYIEAATYLVHVQRPAVLASTTGTGGSSSRIASATPPPRPASTARCALLDEAGIDGELAVRETRIGSRRGHADVGPSAVRARGVPPHPLPVGGPMRC